MRGSSFHQANATVEALTAEMSQIRNELVNSINSLSTMTPPTLLPPTTTLPHQAMLHSLPDNQMNTTVGQQTLLDAIQQLQKQIRNL